MGRFTLFLIFLLLLAGCSTRGLNDRYASVTEQRLVTQSLDKLVKALPAVDFEPLRKQTVYLQGYFIEPTVEGTRYSPLLKFARQRVKLELMEKYQCKMVKSPEKADYQVHFFFNAIGTDQDSLGITLPQIFLPGVGVSQIDLIAVEMFHGVSEGYYFIVDKRQAETLRGKLQKARVRTDRLNLPFISIPLNTLD